MNVTRFFKRASRRGGNNKFKRKWGKLKVNVATVGNLNWMFEIVNMFRVHDPYTGHGSGVLFVAPLRDRAANASDRVQFVYISFNDFLGFGTVEYLIFRYLLNRANLRKFYDSVPLEQ